MNDLAAIKTSRYQVRLEGETGPFEVTTSVRKESEGLEFIRLVFESDRPAPLHDINLVWNHPAVNTHNAWHPACGRFRCIGPNWSPTGIGSKGTAWAPVLSLYDISGQNALTFAVSDCLNATVLSAGVEEETGLGECKIRLLTDPLSPTKRYEVVARLDTRPIPYYESLRQVGDWWSKMPGHEPCEVPEHARLPLYSAWYSFHQQVNPEGLENQCRIAKTLGMESIIIDDGWQTDDNNRGYAYCGDWEVTENKLPNFEAHIARVHEIGMKYIVWFSVPFVGIHSKAYQRFKDKVLDPDSKEWFVLDPRFPEVRDYLIGIYEDFVKRYDIDGFKLDFVDSFRATAKTRDLTGDGRDYASVPEAVDRLLHDALTRLKRLKSDILIEFRQTYIGPLMRKYGNMLRAGDVPDNFAGNRVSTLDIRLICGNTPAHSDMVMWHADEPVESAAMQIIHTIFSVPQVSVMLDRIPKDHLEMVRFLLSFWRENRDVLMDGELMPMSPEMLYPVVLSRTSDKMLAACYSSGTRVMINRPVPKTLILVNGSYDDSIALDLSSDIGHRTVSIYRCTGEQVGDEKTAFTAGLHRISVPPAGIAFLRA